MERLKVASQIGWRLEKQTGAEATLFSLWTEIILDDQYHGSHFGDLKENLRNVEVERKLGKHSN